MYCRKEEAGNLRRKFDYGFNAFLLYLSKKQDTDFVN